jgi:hypothetical protein
MMMLGMTIEWSRKPAKSFEWISALAILRVQSRQVCQITEMDGPGLQETEIDRFLPRPLMPVLQRTVLPRSLLPVPQRKF